MNDSQIENMSLSGTDGNIFSGMNMGDTLNKPPVQGGKPVASKPRLFTNNYVSNTIMLDLIGATQYDTMEDMRNLNLQTKVHEAVEALKMKWKTNDIEVIKDQIKRCVISELNKLEERKLTLKNQKEIRERLAKKKRDAEDNADLQQTKSLNQSQMSSPMKGV